MTWQQRLGALAICGAFAMLHTWPLANDVSGLSRLDNADGALNTWIVSWVADQLPRHPTAIFDAPIFHPERHTLAYSEHLLAQGAMAVPLRAAGLSPTSTYNVVVLIGLTLSAWSMWLLVAAWTGDTWAGAVAGLAFAFNAHTLTRFGQIQGLHLEFVPIVFLALDRLVTRARTRDAVLLGVGLALAGLTSVYLLTFVAGAICAGTLARVFEWRDRTARTLAGLGLGLTIAVVLLLPALWPYWTVNRDAGLVRSLDEVTFYSATWRDYLAAAGRIHYETWSAPFHRSATSLFPGLTVLALAIAGIVYRRGQTGRVWMLAAIAATGVVLSFGPALPLYRWLYALVPLFRAIRVASRWGGLWLMATAALAGIGLAALRSRLADRARLAVSCLAVLLVTVEALRAPMGFTPTPPVEAVYAHIAGLPRAVLVEFPLYPTSNFNLNAPYLVAQVDHHKPIVNGYSGFAPAAYDTRVHALETFPGEASHAMLHDLGVTHVVLHLRPLREAYGEAALDALDRLPWLRRTYADPDARVYQVLDTPAPADGSH